MKNQNRRLTRVLLICALLLATIATTASAQKAKPAPAKKPTPAAAKKTPPAQLQKACDAGNAKACLELGDRYQHGTGVPLDEEKATALYAKACDGREMKGCYQLGLAYVSGTGVPKDLAKAATLYATACPDSVYSEWVPAACDARGRLYWGGHGVTKDEAKALTLYARACEGGAVAGCGSLGLIYIVGPLPGISTTPQDFGKALTFYTKACAGNYLNACTQLGRLYYYGRGTAKDQAKAAALFFRDCERGESSGCNDLALSYASGAGVDRNPQRAATLYARACTLGYRDACDEVSSAGSSTSPQPSRPGAAAPAVKTTTSSGVGFEILGVKIGVSTFALVNRNLGVRGASQSFGYNGVKFRVYAREGNFSDWGQRVFWVAYDFESNDANARLLGVTITYLPAAGGERAQLLRDRAAVLSAKWGGSTSKSPGEYQTASGVRITLVDDPKNEVVSEIYILAAGAPAR